MAAILAYIAARGNCQGPFFLTGAGTPLTKPNFIADLRRVLAAAGLPQDDYAGHSFRIGGRHLSCSSGSGGFNYTVVGWMAKLSIPALCQDPPGKTCGSFQGVSSPWAARLTRIPVVRFELNVCISPRSPGTHMYIIVMIHCCVLH